MRRPVDATRLAAGLRLAVALLAGASCPPAARAQSWDGSLGVTSDNLYRGRSLSAGQPAWLADAHAEFDSGWVVGLSASAERSANDSPGAQLTLYVDRRWQLDEDWGVKLGAARYESPWSTWRDELSYDEINAALGYRGRWSASLAVSPDRPRAYSFGTRRRGPAAWAEVTFRQPLLGRLSADVGGGYAALSHSGDRDYRYGSLGLSYGAGDVHAFLTKVWTSTVPPTYLWEGYGERARPLTPWAASLVWAF